MTPAFRTAINNSSVLKQLCDNTPRDVHVHVCFHESTKDEMLKHGREDILYRIIFKLKTQKNNLFDKLLAPFSTSKIPLTSKYHSEYTTINLLSNDDYMSKLFAKQLISAK